MEMSTGVSLLRTAQYLLTGRTIPQFNEYVLLDFSLTVKAATLIFIFGCGSAISSAKEGKSGFIYNLVRVYKLFEPRKRACIS